MAILKGDKIYVHDPYNLIRHRLPRSEPLVLQTLRDFSANHLQASKNIADAGVFVDDIKPDLPPSVLVLRPASLVAGIGCNRDTDAGEIRSLLTETLASAELSLSSLKCIASIDVKADENGLIELGHELDLPLVFFSRQDLNRVLTIENPSKVVEKHVGVKSVCEAAAILAARNGNLIVAKQKTQNVTVAIARIDFSSLASAPEVPTI